jgi:hypothetical protein
MRCCVPLLFIWLVRHIETETLIFKKIWWFDQKPLKLFILKEWENFPKDDWKVKLQKLLLSLFNWRAIWMRNTTSLMSCGKKLWVPLIGVTRYISYAPTLVAR